MVLPLKTTKNLLKGRRRQGRASQVVHRALSDAPSQKVVFSTPLDICFSAYQAQIPSLFVQIFLYQKRVRKVGGNNV